MALDQTHDEAQMGFLDHLEELRRRLFVSAAAILAAGIGVFVAKDWVFDRILFGPRNLDFISYRGWCALSHAIGSGDALCVERISYELINTTMLGNFSAHLIVSAVGGLIVAFPVLIHQVWAFVKPAMKAQERNAARGAGLPQAAARAPAERQQHRRHAAVHARRRDDARDRPIGPEQAERHHPVHDRPAAQRLGAQHAGEQFGGRDPLGD